MIQNKNKRSNDKMKLWKVTVAIHGYEKVKCFVITDEKFSSFAPNRKMPIPVVLNIGFHWSEKNDNKKSMEKSMEMPRQQCQGEHQVRTVILVWILLE